MKKNDFVQIKGLDIKDLMLKAKGFKLEIANLVVDKNMKQMKDLKMISKKRKELAQVLTIARQKELLSKLENEALKISDTSKKKGKTELSKKE